MDTEIHVGEVTTKLTATDTEALLSPTLLRQIVNAVLAELDDQEAYKQRRQNEHSLSEGVSHYSHSRG